MPPKTKPAPAAEEKPAEQGYTGLSAAIAADVRELGEKIREDIDALTARVHEINGTHSPDDAAVADALRRVPMAAADVLRAAEGLVASGVHLADKAAR